MNLSRLESARRLSAMKAFMGSLNRRTGLIAVALGGIATAMYFGWDWLAAAGLTTLIIGFLPCAVMCGFGLCASRLVGKGGTATCADKQGNASTAPRAPSVVGTTKDAPASR